MREKLALIFIFIFAVNQSVWGEKSRSGEEYERIKQQQLVTQVFGLAELPSLTGCWHGKWEIQLYFGPEENPLWQVWCCFKVKAANEQLNVTNKTLYQQVEHKWNYGSVLFSKNNPVDQNTKYCNPGQVTQKACRQSQNPSYAMTVCLFLFVCPVISLYIAYWGDFFCLFPHNSWPHAITAMFCASHSCFKGLIFSIFYPLVWSKNNMLNLFKAFQSDDGKAFHFAFC